MNKITIKIIKKLSACVITLLAIGVILIPTINSIMLEAAASEYLNIQNPEGILNISFNEKTSFTNTINRLNSFNGSKNILINSVTGYTVENNNILPFVFNGVANETNPNGVILLKNVSAEYRKHYTNYINELKQIKNNNTNLTANSAETNIAKNQEKGIKNITNSYSNNDFETAKNKTKWFATNLFIDKITISSSLKTLDAISKNRIIAKSIKESNLTNILQLEKEFKGKQAEIEKNINSEIKKAESLNPAKKISDAEKEAIKQSTIESETKKEIDKMQTTNANIQNDPISNLSSKEQELLKSITPEQIKQIDEKINIDQKGNSLIAVQTIDNINNIDTEKANLVKKLVDNTNNKSEIDKEINLLQPIMTKAVTNPVQDTSIVGKVGSMLGGNVEAKAWWCNVQNFNWGNHWWGVVIRANTCWTSVVQYVAVAGIGLSFLYKLIPFGFTNILGIVGGAIFGFISAMAYTANQVSKNCRNGGWVTVHIGYFHPRHWHNC